MSRSMRWLRRVLHGPFRLAARLVLLLPGFRFVSETRDTQTPITFGMWVRQEILGINQGPYWPVHPSSCVVGWRNILSGVETSPGMMPGCYIQGIGTIRIGDYTQIAPNVGIISANHVLHDLRRHDPKHVRIGRYCWLGMGSLVLPGVSLGDFTIVTAGAVVTRSFPDGYCVIGGNPAQKLKDLDPADCVEHRSRHEYHGFISKDRFEEFRRRELNIPPSDEAP